jgi:hypothetical protein
MPKNAIVHVPTTWVRLTDVPVLALTVQNRGSHSIEMLNDEGAVAVAGLRLPVDTALINRAVSDLFPGAVAVGVASHLWARAVLNSSEAFVSYA